MNRAIPALSCALMLSGCMTTQQVTGEPVPLEELIRQLKSDVGQYNAYATAHANDAPLNTACGGKVDLTIKALTVSVTTSAKLAEGATAGAEVTPFAFLKAGASGAVSGEYGNSQVLTFTVVPASGGTAASPNSPAGNPALQDATRGQQDVRPPSQLLAVLTNLRESLLKASDTTPCLRFPETDQDNSIEFGFTATRSRTVGGAINLFIFSLGASRTNERTASHTIKVSFEGSGNAFFEVG